MAISLQCRRNLGVHDSTSSSFSSISSISSSISRAAFGKVQTADPLGVRVFGPDGLDEFLPRMMADPLTLLAQQFKAFETVQPVDPLWVHGVAFPSCAKTRPF